METSQMSLLHFLQVHLTKLRQGKGIGAVLGVYRCDVSCLAGGQSVLSVACQAGLQPYDKQQGWVLTSCVALTYRAADSQAWLPVRSRCHGPRSAGACML